MECRAREMCPMCQSLVEINLFSCFTNQCAMCNVQCAMCISTDKSYEVHTHIKLQSTLSSIFMCLYLTQKHYL